MKVYATMTVLREIEFDVPESLIPSYQHFSSDTASDEDWDAVDDFQREEVKKFLLPNEELYAYDITSVE